MRFTGRLCSFALAGTLLLSPLACPPARAAEDGSVLWLDTFDAIEPFHCGYAYVNKGDEGWLVNASGTQLEVDPTLECVGSFRNGFAPVQLAESNIPPYMFQTMGWIGLDGTLKIPTQYFDTCYASFQRNTLFTTRVDGQVVTLGANGQVIGCAPAEMALTDSPWANYNGLAPAYVLQPDGAVSLGFADRNWELVIPAHYQSSYSGFTQGGALVSKPDSDDFYYINCLGEEIWGPVTWEDAAWLQVTDGFWDGLLSVPGENGKWGAIDTHGTLVIPYEYDRQFVFSSGVAFAAADGQLQVIDTSGRTVLSHVEAGELDWNSWYSFSEGLAAVCREGKWGYIDLTGREVIPCVYADAQPFSEGLAWVQREDGMWGILKSPLAARSDWADEEIRDAYIHELVTERTAFAFQSTLTRMQCAELMTNLAEMVTGRPIFEAEYDRFTDTMDWIPRKAAAVGLTEGAGDGSYFKPDGSVTREQLAAMLFRTISYLEAETGQTVLTESGSLAGYDDAGQVSDWAREAMAALNADGILRGTSGSTLSPKDTTTVEQGILLALRTYQKFIA